MSSPAVARSRIYSAAEDTVLFPWPNATPRRGIVVSVPIAAAFLLGNATGHPAAGSIAAGAAFTVGFALFHEALASSLLSMAILTVSLTTATFFGSIAEPHTWSALVVVVIAAVNYGLLSGLGATAGWIGMNAASFAIINSGIRTGANQPFGRASMVLLGGIMQMLTIVGARLVLTPLLHRMATPAPGAPVTGFHRFLLAITGHRSSREVPLSRQLVTRAQQLFGALLRELHWSDDITGYVLRLTFVLLVTTGISRYYRLGNGYWSPMTALLVLKPRWGSTLSRGIARLLGTVLGAAIALAIARVYLLAGTPLVMATLAMVWACYWLQAVNYAAYSVVLTLYTIFSFRIGGFSNPTAAQLRVLNTVVGGGLALLIDFLWQHFAPGARKAPAADAQARP